MLRGFFLSSWQYRCPNRRKESPLFAQPVLFVLRKRQVVYRILFATLAYLASGLWVFHLVLSDPMSTLPFNQISGEVFQQMGHWDQSMVVFVIMRNAELMISNPSLLFGYGQCFPFEKSFTLGEHMFGEGILAAVPWWITGDPILTYNLLLLTTLLLPALAMFVLVRHFTRSSGAAFVAGLLLQLVTTRILDGGHPFLHAEFWLPFALLCLHRLFVTGRLLPAIGIFVFLSLQALETIYMILGCFVVVGVYVPYLWWRHPDRRIRKTGLVLAAGVGVVLVGLRVLLPYLEIREAWDVLAGNPTAFLSETVFLPGRLFFPGWIFAGLVVIAVADRVRRYRPRDGEDPRLVMLLAAFLIFWCAIGSLTIPGTTFQLSSPLRIAAEHIDAFGAVRGLLAINHVMWVPLAFLAGFGALVVLERFRGPYRAVVLVLLVGGILSTRFVPSLAQSTFGAALDLGVWSVRPSAAEVQSIREFSEGAVAVLPPRRPGRLRYRESANDLLLLSFSPRPTISCYNSFDSPFANQMFQLLSDLPSAASSEALGALGVRTVFSRLENWVPETLQLFDAQLQESEEARRNLVLVDEKETLRTYRVVNTRPVGADMAALKPGKPWLQWSEGGEREKFAFWVRNNADFVFLDRQVRPRDVWVRWKDETGEIVRFEKSRALLPIALGPGQSMRIEASVTPPTKPGVWKVWLSLSEGGDHFANALLRIGGDSPHLDLSTEAGYLQDPEQDIAGDAQR